MVSDKKDRWKEWGSVVQVGVTLPAIIKTWNLTFGGALEDEIENYRDPLSEVPCSLEGGYT